MQAHPIAIGDRFGKLTVCGLPVPKEGRRRRSVPTLCDCGSPFRVVRVHALVTGKAKSCGCVGRKGASVPVVRHGLSALPEFRAWEGMKARCNNPKAPGYHRYGGRGIAVCAAWLHDFQGFFAYVGPRPTAAHSIDRWPDNDGDYEPGNVRWATRSEQNRNRRGNRLIEAFGITLTLVEWSNMTGIASDTLAYRLRNNDAETALSTAVHRIVVDKSA